MKLGSRRLILGVLLSVLVGCIGYQYVRLESLIRVHAQSTSAIAGALGKLVFVAQVVGGEESRASQEIERNVRKAITPLALALTYDDPDVAGMGADAFAGLCALIASSDVLFPISQVTAVDAHVNGLLNTRLQGLRAVVTNESAARSLRLGDRHTCALQANQVAR